MKSGNIVEYIDQQKILCAVILEVKKQRLRLLTETNREVNLSASRLSHIGDISLDLSLGRDKLVERLAEIANRRNDLIHHVDIKGLWEVLNTEQEWIDLSTMTALCFPHEPTYDHEAAVVRAFFKNRLYFKFSNDQFFPNSEKRVEQITIQIKEADWKNRIVEQGGDWLKKVLNGKISPSPPASLTVDEIKFVNIITPFYLFEKESKDFALARAMLLRAGIKDKQELFPLLIKLGVWDENENIALHQYQLPVSFPEKLTPIAKALVDSFTVDSVAKGRKDLTMMPVITIDGQSTLDFDDAISIEDKGKFLLLGVHIADVGQFVKKGGHIDQEAILRGSSIYMPDQKIPMVPPGLAENLCSLKAGEIRPVISTMIKLTPNADIIDYEIFPSLVRVKQQLSYYDTNQIADENWEIATLYSIAKHFRQERLDRGAVQITLPEVNIWIDDGGRLSISKTNRESPGRMLVAEIMIMANWLTAKFLAERKLPAIFRSQPEPRERLLKKSEGTLFQNWMQRKRLSRFALKSNPDPHSGLGLEAYVTATSPIRRYFDLATQRQIRSVFGWETPYTTDEINQMIQVLEQPTANVSRLQYGRNRYWLLKYLEEKKGQKEEAIVLYKLRNNYQILLTEYMIECSLPLSAGTDLKPEDLIQVTIQHTNARKDVLSVFLG